MHSTHPNLNTEVPRWRSSMRRQKAQGGYVYTSIHGVPIASHVTYGEAFSAQRLPIFFQYQRGPFKLRFFIRTGLLRGSYSCLHNRTSASGFTCSTPMPSVSLTPSVICYRMSSQFSAKFSGDMALVCGPTLQVLASFVPVCDSKPVLFSHCHC